MTLYDAHGKPLRRPDLLREQGRPSLVGIRQAWVVDAVAKGLTPFRLQAALESADRGDTLEFLTLATELEERDVRYGTALGVRKRAVLGVRPVVEAVSDSAADRDLADEVRTLAEAPPFRRLCAACLDGLGKGWAAVEIDWLRSGASRWRPQGYLWRDPRWFRWNLHDPHELRLLDESAPIEGLPLSPGRWVVHCPSLREGIPARGGLARIACAAFLLRSYALRDWMGFLDVFGVPVRIGKYDKAASEDDRRALQRAVREIGSGASATIPESMQIELVEAARGSATDAFERICRWLDQQTAEAVLGQSATTEGTPGRLGSDEAQADVRHDILVGDCADLADTIRRDLVVPYVALNHGPRDPADCPRLILRPPDPEDTDSLAKALSMLVPLGLRVEAQAVRKRLGMAEPPDGAEVLEGRAATDPAAVQAQARALALAAARAGERESLLGEIEAGALDGWRPVMEPLLEPVRALAAQASSYEEFLAGLPGLLGEMDPSELARALALATFQARGLGDARDEP